MIYKDLYKMEKGRLPLVNMFFIISCLVVIISTKINSELFYVFGSNTKPKYFWQYFSGIFEHSLFNPMTGRLSEYFIFVHFGVNLMIIILFGLIIENILGGGKLLLLNLIGTIISYLSLIINSEGKFGMFAGASGIAYSYIPIGIYIIYKKCKDEKINFFKQGFSYIYILCLIITIPIITMISTWKATNSYHLYALIIGSVFLIFNKKSIDNRTYKKGKYYNLLWGLAIVPILMLVIAIVYNKGILGSVYYWWGN